MIILTTEILEKVSDNNAFVVLIKSIAKRASFDSNQACFPSLATICKDTGLTKPTVIKSLRYLSDIGIVTIQKRQKPNSKESYSNYYTINTDLIKIIGNLKVGGGSKGDLPPSKGDLPPLVKEVYSNHKTNITSSTNNYNSLGENPKILEFFSNPLYPKLKSTEFPKLTDKEIKLKLELIFNSYPNIKPTSIFKWLKEENDKKQNTPTLTDNSFLKNILN